MLSSLTCFLLLPLHFITVLLLAHRFGFWLHAQVTVTVFKAGDIVKVIGDRTSVEELQNIYGIWDDAMIEVRHYRCSRTPNLAVILYLCVSMCVSVQIHQSLGQIGCVTEILNPVVLEVLIN